MVIKLCTQNTLQLIVTKYFIHIEEGEKGWDSGNERRLGLKNVTFESRHEVKEHRPIDIHGGCFVSSSFFCSFSAISKFFLFLILILKGRENKKQRRFTCCFT